MDNNGATRSSLKVVSSIMALISAIFFLLTAQGSLAAVITCPTGSMICDGTAADDIIVGTTANAIIHGLAGNDYIIGAQLGPSIIWETTGMI